MKNNKQIFSISMVKNEMDIIESFVRYNINIFDGMIILDNGSTDDTLEILKLLKSEGLSLFLVEDGDREYDQAAKMNQLLLKAVNEFNADIIVPLDADEFLVSAIKGNPRKIMEKIDDRSYFQIKWKTYIPDFEKNENKTFIPSKITFVRDESLEEFYKVIIPKNLVKNYNVRVSTGNHDLLYQREYEEHINPVINEELRIAHFPIRSKEQTASKIMVGWIYFMCRPERGFGGFHWERIFNQLKGYESIKNEDIINFAKVFALENEETEVTIKEDPLDLSFCQDIEIKYTKNKINPMANLLEACQWLSESYLGFKEEKFVEETRLKNQIENLSLEMYEFHNERIKEKELSKRKIEEYKNSSSWKITSPLRKFGFTIKKWSKNHKSIKKAEDL
jgi:glycosyltransferase involved in cell wall biosynthesis